MGALTGASQALAEEAARQDVSHLRTVGEGGLLRTCRIAV
jgi:hypothetical protein